MAKWKGKTPLKFWVHQVTLIQASAQQSPRELPVSLQDSGARCISGVPLPSKVAPGEDPAGRAEGLVLVFAHVREMSSRPDWMEVIPEQHLSPSTSVP